MKKLFNISLAILTLSGLVLAQTTTPTVPTMPVFDLNKWFESTTALSAVVFSLVWFIRGLFGKEENGSFKLQGLPVVGLSFLSSVVLAAVGHFGLKILPETWLSFAVGATIIASGGRGAIIDLVAVIFTKIGFTGTLKDIVQGLLNDILGRLEKDKANEKTTVDPSVSARTKLR